MTQDAGGPPDGVPGGTPWWGEPWGAGSQPDGQPPVDQPTAARPTGPPPTAGSTAPLPPGVPPYAGYGTPPPPPPEHRHGYLRTSAVILIAVVALLAGGAGAAIGVTVGRDQHDHTTSAVAVSASVNATSSGSENAIEAVAASLSPAVVLVTEQVQEDQGELVGTGSGVVLDAAKGYILTNNHVVSAFATDGGTLTVTTMAGKTVPATVVGRDPTADIAVIHVSLTGLTQARLGDSSAVKVGQTVVAFGAPLGLQGTVTSGIVSALHRPVSTEDTTDGSSSTAATQATIDAIQTDAAINPGNSGGPLVDLSGDVIGINSAIASVAGASGDGQTTESGNIGVGFAIPINEALYTADQLIATGHAVHAIIGVSLAADTDATQSSGATVAAVTAGGPAAKAGIEKGDVITAIDGSAIPDADAAIVAVRADHKPGDVVSITFTRGGKAMTVQVTLGASAPS